MRSRRLVGSVAALATVIGGSAFAASVPATAGSVTSPAFAPSAGDANVKIGRGNNGRVDVIQPKQGTVVARGSSSKPEVAARQHLSNYASKFGVSSGSLQQASVAKVGNGSVVKYDQTIGGVKVWAGQLAASVDTAGGLQSLSGETSQHAGSFPFASRAKQGSYALAAKRAVATRERLGSTAGLTAAAQGPIWFDPALVGFRDGRSTTANYRFEVTGPDLRYDVFVNAKTGQVELAYSRIEHALKRVVCDLANKSISGSAQYKCDGKAVKYARVEGGAASKVADVNKVYEYFKDTSVRYAANVGVDVTNLIGADFKDGKGKALRATVRTCVQGDDCPYLNAFWDGTQMVFGQDITTDDITGHELTHGVTEHTSQLAYLFQSGAINEGFSDIWGELIDLGNGKGLDNSKWRWKLGEGSGFKVLGGKYKDGVIRDMKSPPAFDQPDKMTSSLWVDDPELADNGGVHGNSGVLNKAGYLMTDGGSFNGYSIKGLGPAKTSKILWTLQNLITAGAEYKDIFHLWPVSCRKQIGKKGTFVTEADCKEVDKVVRATEMYKDPVTGAAKEVDYCTSGSVKKSYFEDFESKNAGWAYGASSGSYWLLGSEVGYRYNKTGNNSAVFWPGDKTAQALLTQKAGITIPAGSFLRFDHSYLFATDDPNSPFNPSATPVEGGYVEYKVGSGAWTPLSNLSNVNGEDKSVTLLPGKKAFGLVSNGYGGTRYDLSSLAGKSVRFRFVAKASSFYGGWWMDNFKVYSCS